MCLVQNVLKLLKQLLKYYVVTPEGHYHSWLKPCLPAHRVVSLPRTALDLKDKVRGYGYLSAGFYTIEAQCANSLSVLPGYL